MRTLRVVVIALQTAAARSAAVPSGLVVAGVFHLMVTAVLAGVWRVAADVNGGVIVGYSAIALVWYIATSEAATVSLPQRLIDDIGTDIGSGAFTIELLRPASALAIRVATSIGDVLPRLAVCAVGGVGFAWLTAGAPPRPAALALALPSLVLAVTLNICAQHAFASAAFWVLDAKGTWFLYQKLVFVLGGMLLPLEVLPSGMEQVARWLPFASMAYAPARLASGHLEPELLAIQFGWLVVIAAVAVRSFASGERHLIASGA